MSRPAEAAGRTWLLLFLLAMALLACQESGAPRKVQDVCWIEHQQIALGIAPDMHYRLYLRQGRQWLGLNRPAYPAQSVQVAGQSIMDFIRDPGEVAAERITTDWGLGWRWTLRARSTSVPLRQITTVEGYDTYPQVFILQTAYENLGLEPVVIEQVNQNALLVDASLTRMLDKPYHLTAFDGASWEWQQPIVFSLRPGIHYDGYLGQVETGEGGGIPLLYLWNPHMGVALAHLELAPRLWHMPLHVNEDGAHISFQRRETVSLEPGERLQGLRTMLSVHRGDYYAPLRLYAELMSAQGWRLASPSPQAYEPVWSGWGYEFNFTMEEMLGVIPMLQELGIRWAAIDDRWFDAYGHWMPRRDTFPRGEADMKALIQAYHDAGIRVQLWWYPLAVEDDWGAWASHAYRLSPVVAEHPDWLILDEVGRPARNNRNLAILCPALPEVQAHVVELVERFVGEWGIDGHKLDNVYTVPPCHNPAHGHARPEEAVEALVEAYRFIWETTKRLKPDGVTMISPCGSTPNVYLLPYVDQPMMSDPFGSWQIRMRIKALKALIGPDAPVFADHVELTDSGDDFASLIGPGGVPGTKFVWPHDPRVESRVREDYYLLSEAKQSHWKRWLDLYHQLMLSQGEYLNLYDTIYHRPEGHVIAKDGRLYYAFFTERVGERYQGPIVLLGLERGQRYRLRNYESGQELGTVRGPAARLQAEFQSHVLLEAIPD